MAVTGQMALDFAQDELHGQITLHFSRGSRPVQCTLMADDGSWHDADGDTLAEAVYAAIMKSGSTQMEQAWRDMLE